MKLNELMITSNELFEKTGVDLPSKQQHESDFGNMAFVFLKDRAPQLIPNLIGFETIDMEDDGSKAAGIFGIKVEDELFYVPFFFVNSQIKGMDSLYSVNKDFMVPLTEAWINKIINRKSVSIGDNSDAKMDEFIAPDFQFLRQIPSRSGMIPQTAGNYKLSSAIGETRLGWKAVTDTTINKYAEDPVFRAEFARALQSLFAPGEDIEKTADDKSLLIEYLENSGGPAATAELLRKAAADVEFGDALMRFYDLDDFKQLNYKMRKTAKVPAKVEVITSEYVSDNMPSEEKRKIVRDGFTIKDNRSPEEKSQVYYPDRFICSNPDKPGMYKVYIQGGVNKTCAVLQPSLLRGTYMTRPVTVVVNPDDKTCFLAENTAVFTAGLDEDAKSIYDKAKSLDKLEPNEQVMLINENLDSAFPIKIKAVDVAGDIITLRAHICPASLHQIYRNSTQSTPRYDDDYPYGVDRNVIIILKDGSGVAREVGGHLTVPMDSYRAVVIDRDNKKLMRPATEAEIKERMATDGIQFVKVKSDNGGINYSIWMDEQPEQYEVTYKTAMLDLVNNQGFPVKAAEIMLKEAATNFTSDRLIVKTAQGAVAMPSPRGTDSQGYDAQVGVPIQTPVHELVPGQTMSSPPVNTGPGYRGNIGGTEHEQEPDNGTPPGELAQEAAQLGQQHVFDTATIGAMAKTYDPSLVIDSYIPEFMQSLDRLGRILFLFYWKNEDFAERYGDQDMTAMEDELKNVYKNFGDLVLKLQQKSIDPEEGAVIG